MAKVYDPILCMMVEEKVSTKDASRGHEIVVKTQNYLNSIGKNNSVGKYDRIVHGVKYLLEQGFLEGPELERAIKQEADRLLKKYNLDERPEGMTCDAKAYSVSYRKGNGPYQSIGVMANSESEAIEKFKKHLASKKQEAEIFGASIGESLETMKMKGKPVLDNRTIDEAIRMCDKDVSFPSEKEAIEYCKENGIDPHKIKTIGDKYVVSE